MPLTIGVHEDWTDGGRTPAQVKVRYPGAKIGRAFTGAPKTTVQDLRPSVKTAIQPYLDANVKKIYVSVKTDIASTRAGSWNARYTELGVAIASWQTQYNCEIILIPWHEPEDDFTDGLAYVHYYNKVRSFTKAGSSAVKVKPCFMTYHWAPNSNNTASIDGKTNSPSHWLNGLEMGDGICYDAYNGRSFPLDQIAHEHPGVARLIANLPSTVRLNMGERGWETPSSTNTTNRSALRVTTMDREFDWLLSGANGAERYDDVTLWSSPGTEGSPGLVFDAAAEDLVEDFIVAVNTPPTPPPTADPNHAQYQFGYKAGWNGAMNEVGLHTQEKILP